MTDTPVRGWSGEAVVTFDNTDTATRHDLYLLLRRNVLFTGDTLRLNVCALSPDSLLYCEQAAFPILRTRRSAALHDVLRIPYRRSAVFAREGRYRICFTPEHPVDGIEAVGIDIVKSE